MFKGWPSVGGFRTINSYYQQKKVQEDIRQALHRDFPAVTLQQFLTKDVAERMAGEIRRLSFHHQKKPQLYSYASALPSASIKNTLAEPALWKWLENIFGKKVKILSPKIIEMCWKDYTILHDSVRPEPGIDFILDFTPSWPQDAGGDIVYVDQNGGSHSISPVFNQLALVIKLPKTQRYFKYVNHRAGKKERFFLVGKLG